MSDPRDWIAASLLPGLGPATLARLRRDGVDLPTLLDSDAARAAGLRLRADTLLAIADYQRRGQLWQRAEALLEQAERQQWQLLTPADPAYPILLQQIPDPPPVLWLSGEASVLSLPQLALVGSRKASREGVRLAYAFAAALAQAGLTPVSGLALGIDGAAHRACVDHGRPTVAVIGSGLDRVYPRQHQGLAQAILEQGGALVSEWPPGTPPLPTHFPRRNRIISGLAVGTLVVQAALRSGSLITARQALEQGREVFAIPGSIHDPLSRGCHALIREGAMLVEQVEQIIEPLAALLGVLVPAPSVEATTMAAPAAAEAALLERIPFAPVWLDALAAELDWPVAELQAGLMQLELDGHIELAGSRVRRLR